MLIPVRHLVDRMRQPRSRADELHALRSRLVAEPRRGSAREVALASELRALRRELSRAIGPLASCAGCERARTPAAGRRPSGRRPSGRRAASDAAQTRTGVASTAARPGGETAWPGGYCCGGRTEVLFSDAEVAALRQGGTTPGRLSPPRSEHTGCAFRGPAGCSLDPADRPTRCVIFLCTEAARELHDRGALDDIERLIERLSDTFARFARARTERQLDDAASDLSGALARAST